MNQIFKVLLICGFLVSMKSECAAQFENYEYRAPISNAKSGWNSIDLNVETFSKLKNGLNDIRIYLKESGSDEYSEQPFYLDIQSAKFETKKVDFKILNQSQKKDVFFYTFELSNKEAINKIRLDFSNQNFDWSIHLEGSMDNRSWSTLINNYRVVSINNASTKFTHSDLKLPDSKFNFYRISFQSSEKPKLKSAFISKVTKTQANLKNLQIQTNQTEEDKKLKTTSFSIDLKNVVPVSQVTLQVDNENDYYRPFTIEGALDSFETEKGWKYNYKLLYQGIINSYNKNTFDFESEILKKLKITVHNFDDQPLKFGETILKCPNYRLITRLEDNNNLQFVFGNEKANKPKYDITHFKDKIPEKLNRATVGEIKQYSKKTKNKSQFFKNKWWLWACMVIVILLLGSFTIKMIKEQN